MRAEGGGNEEKRTTLKFLPSLAVYPICQQEHNNISLAFLPLPGKERKTHQLVEKVLPTESTSVLDDRNRSIFFTALKVAAASGPTFPAASAADGRKLAIAAIVAKKHLTSPKHQRHVLLLCFL